MTGRFYVITDDNSSLLFNCLVQMYKDEISIWETYELSTSLGVDEKQIVEIFEVLLELKIIRKEDDEYWLEYDSLKGLLNSHENQEFIDYLNKQFKTYVKTGSYLISQFTDEEDNTDTEDNEEEYVDIGTQLELAEKERQLKRQQEKDKEQKKKEEKEAKRKYVFTSSRIGGQDIFVETIVIHNGIITWSKGHLLSKKEISFSIDKVSSVEISSGLMYVDITIKSTNGKIQATNFTKGDARDIKSLLEN